MTLVDTSVWIDHLEVGIDEMQELLQTGDVVMHAFIIGELAMGNLKPRQSILADLQKLPAIKIATPEEVLRFVSHVRLNGKGIGYIDAHLLAAVRIAPSGCEFWTRDRRLRAAATELGIASPLV